MPCFFSTDGFAYGIANRPSLPFLEKLSLLLATDREVSYQCPPDNTLVCVAVLAHQPLIQNTCADGTINFTQFSQSNITNGSVTIDINYHITDLAIGLQVLGSNIDLTFRKYIIYLGQHPRFVVVNV